MDTQRYSTDWELELPCPWRRASIPEVGGERGSRIPLLYLSPFLSNLTSFSVYFLSFLFVYRATSLADSIGVDFALINRNRKREQNKRLRAAQRSLQGQNNAGLSNRSSFSDLRSGFSTPMSASLTSLPPHPQQLGGGIDSSGVVGKLNDLKVNSESTDSLVESGTSGGNGHGHTKEGLSQIANGVHQNQSGEWVVHDEDGRKITSGGSRSRDRKLSPSNSNQQVGSVTTFVQKEGGEIEEEEESKMEILVGDVAGKVSHFLIGENRESIHIYSHSLLTSSSDTSFPYLKSRWPSWWMIWSTQVVLWLWLLKLYKMQVLPKFTPSFPMVF